jgi:exosortase
MKPASKRNLFFIAFSLATLFIFCTPIREIVRLALYERLYAHMMLVPFVSGYFLFLKRKQIYSKMDYSLKAGILLSLIGILLFWFEERSGLASSLSLAALSALIFWIGGFVLIYGVRAFKVAAFPLLFLLFMVPIPGRALGTIIYLLTWGSAEAAYGYFKVTGVPILREGFTFILPTLTIEVAEQCSGINSSIALFVSSIVAAQLFLRTGWKKIVLVLSIFPITILKNGLRIVTLSLLGAYVDPRILSGDLHRKGGIPFFIVALAMLAPILWLLRRSEKKSVNK